MTAVWKTRVEIQCNTCGEPFTSLDYGVCLYDDEADAREEAIDYGWIIDGDKDYCSPECKP